MQQSSNFLPLKIILAVFLISALASCGQTGPLYLPTTEQTPDSTTD